MKKLLALALAILCLFTTLLTPSLAVDAPTIDTSQTGSLTIYKYDLTSAAKDGLSDTVYLSTGQPDADAAAAFAPYAIPGVEFTILKVGNIDTYDAGNAASQSVQVIYGISNHDLISALGLTASDVVTTKNGVNYYASDSIIHALSDKLTGNNTSTKDRLEAIIARDGNAQALSLTDSTGRTGANNLALGLYLVVETKVPENVTYTVDPFFVSVPMTDRLNNARWHYDITVYPKNQTGVPTLEKQVMDNYHGLSFSNTAEGFADVATMSGNDIASYRISSTLPRMHSTATYLTKYDFVDTLSKGLTYNQQDVKMCWYEDAADAESDYTAATAEAAAVQGTHADAVWNYGSEFFSVTYGDSADGSHTMTVKLTRAGLAEVNQPVDSADQEGKYSGWTMVIYYCATVNTNASMTYGDSGNPNDVTLTWKRTSDNFTDTLTDTARVYSYGIDLTKVLSEGGTAYGDVEFILQNGTNVTGAFYLLASKSADGVYYVNGTTTNKDAATHFFPSAEGKLLVYGLEEDSYILTEVKTASGYTLLKDTIDIDLDTSYTPGDLCGTLSGSAKVDGDSVDMEAMGTSPNALVPFTVLNTRGFDLPKTGGPGTTITTVCGVLVLAAVVAAAFLTRKKKRG